MSWEGLRKVLPATAEVNDAGHLAIGGCDTEELAASYGTPVFVCDLADVRQRLGRYAEAFGAPNVSYAAKAFLTSTFAPVIESTGVGMECVAGGELYVATAGGFPASRITLHGNNKSAQELREALEVGVGRIVVDSFEELELLAPLAVELGVRARVLIRVTPGVEARTHSYLETGVEDSKFGFTIRGQAMEAIRWAAGAEGIELLGLHSHIGSQVFDLEPFAEAARKMVGLLAEAREATGLELGELVLGGGLGVAYLPSDDARPVEDLAKLLGDAVASEAERLDTPVPVVKVEPGRSSVANSMVTLYAVGVVKDVPGVRRFVAVDGGMSDNIRVPLYQARYTFLSASRPLAPHDRASTIAGKLCETGDLIGHDVALPSDVARGEVIATATTGAYGYVMASGYNKLPRPAVVGVEDGRVEVLARRETYDDLIRLERPTR